MSLFRIQVQPGGPQELMISWKGEPRRAGSAVYRSGYPLLPSLSPSDGPGLSPSWACAAPCTSRSPPSGQRLPQRRMASSVPMARPKRRLGPRRAQPVLRTLSIGGPGPRHPVVHVTRAATVETCGGLLDRSRGSVIRHPHSTDHGAVLVRRGRSLWCRTRHGLVRGRARSPPPWRARRRRRGRRWRRAWPASRCRPPSWRSRGRRPRRLRPSSPRPRRP
jgi:hypothetical protein